MLFGLFNHYESEPIEVYEGDFLDVHAPYVEVMRQGDDEQVPSVVACIYLRAGYTVRQIQSGKGVRTSAA
jgi:hypothetical protein